MKCLALLTSVHLSSVEPQRSQQKPVALEKTEGETNGEKGPFPHVLNFMKITSWPFLEMVIIDSFLDKNCVDRYSQGKTHYLCSVGNELISIFF